METITNPKQSERRCPVHRALLQSDRVRVVYGLIRVSPEFAKASNALFPLARTFIYGGCLLDSEKTHGTVEFCQKCRDAALAWSAERRATLSATPGEE
jgi:hypothetical protein